MTRGARLVQDGGPHGMSAFLAAIPALPTGDLARAAAFYRDALGFTVRHQETEFAVLVREEVELHLWLAADASWRSRTGASPVCSGAESFLAGTASCRVRVTGVAALYAQLEPLGVVHPNGRLEVKDWGDREFAVRDPDGNLMTFFEPV
jgi:catechol 2,3-dioxygenase-like lactoylglutathione lyase family enzyme